jgi:hypothetical protein
MTCKAFFKGILTLSPYFLKKHYFSETDSFSFLDEKDKRK